MLNNLGLVCFPESTFRETIFQTFLCLFVIRKVGQRKTISGQRKTLSSQRKTLSGQFQSKKKLTWFSGKCFPFSCVCFPESGFRESTFQTFLCLFASRNVGQWKTLSSKRKIWLGFQESVFLKILRGKHFPEVVKDLKISLFADYIKFDPQTFDCFIYFVLNIYFSISSLKILFLY